MRESEKHFGGHQNDLNLPTFKEPLPEARRLTMDEYVDFVEMNLRLFGKDSNSVRNLTPVNVRFVLD